MTSYFFIFFYFFFQGLYSQKIKTLKNFKIENKENKMKVIK